jgi:hypothetical protein
MRATRTAGAGTWIATETTPLLRCAARKRARAVSGGHGENAMKASLGMKQAAVSVAVFAGLLFALSSIDPRVQERFRELLAGHGDLAALGDRGWQLGAALMTALKYQSIENAPMVVFATVGAVLVLFMVRT